MDDAFIHLLVFADCFIVLYNHIDEWRRIQGAAFQIEFKHL